MTKKPKRHIRRDASRTYCGRRLTGAVAVGHIGEPDDSRPDDCYWCRITLEAERRGVRRDMDDESLENLEAAAELYDERAKE